MLTARGWWFLLFVLTLLMMGAVLALRGALTLLTLGLALFLWFAWQWACFAVQSRLATRRLTVRRELRDERGPVTTLWAGRSFTVRLTAQLGGSVSLSECLLTDRPPAGAGPAEGVLRWHGPLAPAVDDAWEYRVHCAVPGAIRFEGTRLQLADLQGFFYFDTFLRRPATYPVLPKLVDAEAKQRATKRFNLLPPPGVHRHRRPGSGSELLELRDYRPGDPPKQIAWKVTARKGKLITREFESEVPIRCTLFVDASDAVRLGPPGQNAVAGLVGVAATVAQAAAGNRDLVGLAVCDEHEADYAIPARSSSHTIDLLHRLARAANLAPATEAAEVAPLVDRAYVFALEVFPDLLRPTLNHFPAWLPWLWPPPVWTRRRPRQRDYLFNHFLARTFRQRRLYARRKRLAALIAVHYHLPAGALALLLEDDAACARWLQRFLADHQVPYEVPLYDARGRYLFARPAKVEVLAKALLRSVSRGHDNELFVLLTDLLELDEQLGPLLKAVRVARSRHHQVLLVCPWPAGLPEPGPDAPAELPPAGAKAEAIVRWAARARAARAWRSVRKAFGRLGVPVLSAGTGDPARLILLRLEQMRAIQGASRG